MTDTFTWIPAGNPAGVMTYSVRTVQFGDGYSQAVANGINNKVYSWPLTFTGSKSYISDIVSFLDDKQGYQSFYWTPPIGSKGLYRCATYTLTPTGGDVYTLSGTFQQVFA